MKTASSPPSSGVAATTSALSSWRVALVGNPNAGKTTLFNALTGLRQKVGNYPGVTVEKKEGRLWLPEHGEATLLDLPGTYSLVPTSPDETITRDVLLHWRADLELPDAVIVVVDASNLGGNLYLATQVLELGYPTVIALNMSDVARAQGKEIDVEELARELGAPVVACVAIRGEGLDELRLELAQVVEDGAPRSLELTLPEDVAIARNVIAERLPKTLRAPEACALRILADNAPDASWRAQLGPDIAACVDVHAQEVGRDIGAEEARARHTQSAQIARRVTRQTTAEVPRSFSDRVDRVLLHPVGGLAVFALIILLVFQAIYTWASVPMDWIDGLVAQTGNAVTQIMPDGPLRDLLVEGVIAGVGAVVIFLPQILILFFFTGLLEDTGYMARATFLMDRLMARVGLHGRAFIPLVSSFACAIPGIMATRTIADPRDRLTTILVAPLMACSARLPVYALMIGAFIPNRHWGILSLRAVTLFSLYAGGVIAALIVAWFLKRTILKGPPPSLILELPAYKTPSWRNIIVTMWDRASQFLKRAGTVILSLSILLWFLLSYPKTPTATVTTPTAPVAQTRAMPQSEAALDEVESAAEEQQASNQVRYSFAGRLGHAIEPVIAPLGFNWKIGIGLIGAMSAREVFVSTLGTVYSVADADETSRPLQDSLRKDRWPDGRPVWTTLTAVSLLVYFVLAMQCISTLAIVRRETNGWKWPIVMQVYLTALAYFASLIIYQGGKWLGWG